MRIISVSKKVVAELTTAEAKAILGTNVKDIEENKEYNLSRIIDSLESIKRIKADIHYIKKVLSDIDGNLDKIEINT